MGLTLVKMKMTLQDNLVSFITRSICVKILYYKCNASGLCPLRFTASQNTLVPLWHTDLCSQQNKFIHAVVGVVLTGESQTPLDEGDVCRRAAAPLSLLLLRPTFALFKHKHGVLFR